MTLRGWLELLNSIRETSNYIQSGVAKYQFNLKEVFNKVLKYILDIIY